MTCQMATAPSPTTSTKAADVEFAKQFDNVLEGVRASGIFMIIVPDEGEMDVKVSAELGAAILLDKPLVVVAAGRPVPKHLRILAEAVLEGPLDEQSIARAVAEIAGLKGD